MEKTLVRKTSYVSPVYLRRESPHRDDVERYEGEGRPPEEDTLKEWLRDNSVSSKTDIVSELEQCILMAEGVICDLKTRTKFLKSYRGGMSPLSDTAWRIELDIRSQPPEAQLPKALLEELEKRGYSEAS